MPGMAASCLCDFSLSACRARPLRNHRLRQRQTLARRTLTSLFAHVGRLYLDVIVVDSGSDGSAEHVEDRFPGVRTIRCPNRGFGHAGNRALETASARYVLFLEPDTEWLAGSLDVLTAALDSQPEVALCDWTAGSFVVRRSALESSGWLDEQLPPPSGRIELCRRLTQAGWEVVQMPSLAVDPHEQLRTSTQLEAEAACVRKQFARKRFRRRAGSLWPAARARRLRRRW